MNVKDLADMIGTKVRGPKGSGPCTTTTKG